MSALDWIFLAVLLLSVVWGGWRGLVYEVLSLINWVVAFFVAQWLAPDVARWLPMKDSSGTLRYVAGFGLVFIGSVLAGGLLAVLVKKLTAAVGLRPVDRVLGAAFGLLRGVVVLLLATLVVSMTPLRSHPAWQASVGASLASETLQDLKPLLPREVNRYLPA